MEQSHTLLYNFQIQSGLFENAQRNTRKESRRCNSICSDFVRTKRYWNESKSSLGGSPVELDDICKTLCINTGDEWDLRKVLKRELAEHQKQGSVGQPQEVEDIDWEDDDDDE